jgi:hypothetical protein
MRVAVPLPQPEPEPKRQPARPPQPDVAAVLALQRSAGNAAVARMLRRRVIQRKLPDSTQEWDAELSTIDVKSAADWQALLSRLDKTRVYEVEHGAVKVCGNIRLHPNKLAELVKDGLITRVLSRIPSAPIDLSTVDKDKDLKYLKGLGLEFVQQEGRAFSADTVQADTGGAANKGWAVKYAQWLEREGKLAVITPSVLANHAQFYLATAKPAPTKPAWKDDDAEKVFPDVWAQYERLRKGSALQGSATKHLPVAIDDDKANVIAAIRANAGDLNFASDSAALYHATKHFNELVPRGVPTTDPIPTTIKPDTGKVDVNAYVNAAREIIRKAPDPKVEIGQKDAGYKLEFIADNRLVVVRVRADQPGQKSVTGGDAVIASAHTAGSDAPKGAPTLEEQVSLKPLTGSAAEAKFWSLLKNMCDTNDLKACLPPGTRARVLGGDGIVCAVPTATDLDVHYAKIVLGTEAKIDDVPAQGTKDRALASQAVKDVKDAKPARYVSELTVTIVLYEVEGAVVPKDDLTRKTAKGDIREALQPLGQRLAGKAPKDTLGQMAEAKAGYETGAKNAKLGLPVKGTVPESEMAGVRKALTSRDQFNALLDKHVINAADNGQALLDAFASTAASLTLEEKPNYEAIVEQIQAIKQFKEFRGTRSDDTALNAKLVEHVLFPEDTKSGISGGHIDKNLREWVDKHPQYSLVQTHTAMFGSLELKCYDVYFWDVNLNGPAPAIDKADERPSLERDMASKWTRIGNPKTTMGDVKDFLTLGESALLEQASSVTDLLKPPAIKGESKNVRHVGSEASLGFGGTLGFDAKGAPFLKNLFPAAEWIKAHGEAVKPSATTGALVVVK